MRRLGESGYGCVLLVMGLLLAACSSEGETGGASTGGAGGSGASAGSGGAGGATAGSGGGGAGGAGGSSGSAGSSGSGGGSGGTDSFGPSLTGSCMAYVFESCRRQAECAGSYATGCIELTFSCPDIVASVGSTRTAESLRACAEEYAAFPCEKVNAGEIPPCVSPGTRQAGEPCLFNSQCASLSCSAEDQQCGACDALVGENEDCSATGVACDLELVCDETWHCVKPDVTAPGGSGEERDSCESGADCGFNLDCDVDTKRCVPYPTLGMSCAGPRSCNHDDDSYCELDGLVCKALPTLGQPCGVDGWTGTAGHCGENTRCHKTSASVGTCEAPASVGSPCFVDPETQEPDLYSCVEDAYCNAEVSPALCTARLDAGANCGEGGACKSGLSCLCANNDPACASKVCGKLKIDSQSCTAPGDVCHPGFSCTGGVCAPIDSQGLYDAACE